MIWYYVILFFTSLLSAVFSWLPKIDTLPSIMGVDIDTQLSQGVGYFYAFAHVVWPIYDVMLGALTLFTYYGIKMVLRFILGHRAPQ